MDAKDTIGENGADGPDMPRLRGGLPPGRAKVGRPKDPQKSRLTNATVLLADADGRTTVARRYRDIATAIATNQGGGQSRPAENGRRSAADFAATQHFGRFRSEADIN